MNEAFSCSLTSLARFFANIIAFKKHFFILQIRNSAVQRENIQHRHIKKNSETHHKTKARKKQKCHQKHTKRATKRYTNTSQLYLMPK